MISLGGILGLNTESLCKLTPRFRNMFYRSACVNLPNDTVSERRALLLDMQSLTYLCSGMCIDAYAQARKGLPVSWLHCLINTALQEILNFFVIGP